MKYLFALEIRIYIIMSERVLNDREKNVVCTGSCYDYRKS